MMISIHQNVECSGKFLGTHSAKPLVSLPGFLYIGYKAKPWNDNTAGIITPEPGVHSGHSQQ